jgi:hypothetical protein
MAARRAACHLPEQVHHRPKWQLVLDMLDELAGWELVAPVLVADAGYGEVGCFRAGLDARQILRGRGQGRHQRLPEDVHPPPRRTRAKVAGHSPVTTASRPR